MFYRSGASTCIGDLRVRPGSDQAVRTRGTAFADGSLMMITRELRPEDGPDELEVLRLTGAGEYLVRSCDVGVRGVLGGVRGRPGAARCGQMTSS